VNNFKKVTALFKVISYRLLVKQLIFLMLLKISCLTICVVSKKLPRKFSYCPVIQEVILLLKSAQMRFETYRNYALFRRGLL